MTVEELREALRKEGNFDEGTISVMIADYNIIRGILNGRSLG